MQIPFFQGRRSEGIAGRTMREREREREREKAEGIETREGWAKACFTAPSLPSSILSPFRRRFIHSFIHAIKKACMHVSERDTHHTATAQHPN
mmetsp:Transcript_52776/g.103195  ORF Transcript_52776/g.103195 Transcript_52776/m.103195 type:complete len:93 (-) Transcript_52776:473-751(-)